MKKDEKWISFSKLIWIFLIGAVAGYIIETSFYYIKHGEFLSKQGLLYGPIKPIYGIGAVIYTLMLYFLKNKQNWKIFVYGCIIGGIFEYVCSLVLEYCFGTRMWSYKNMGLDINGRVYLPYLIGWGGIALLYLKVLYPTFNKIYEKVPKKPLTILTILVTVFLVYDVTISSLAVKRMTARKDGVKATTKYQKYMDKHYSDEYILKKVPYLRLAD
ncbi:MAG: putative ABC transporter permease [Bacilli bacterium]|nr:putative ABC transporter permease [Bacilli bacterium]